MESDLTRELPEPKLSRFLFSDTRMAWFWLIVRVYVGWEWLIAGWHKVNGAAWIGENAGQAISGFVKGALAKTTGAHPDVQGWYGVFLEKLVLTHPVVWSHIITWGEVLVGAGLILGAFAGIAAFFGVVMNMNYLLAGTVSSNPVLALLGLFLVFAWRNVGWWGADRWLLPWLGAPWSPGKLFRKKEQQPNG